VTVEPAARWSPWPGWDRIARDLAVRSRGLLTILRRRAIDALRRQNVLVVPLEGGGELSGEDGRETAERFAVVVDVRRALNELPDIQREALVLSHFAGMSQSEVAVRIGAPLGTVKTRSASGLHRLAGLVGRDAAFSKWADAAAPFELDVIGTSVTQGRGPPSVASRRAWAMESRSWRRTIDSPLGRLAAISAIVFRATTPRSVSSCFGAAPARSAWVTAS